MSKAAETQWVGKNRLPPTKSKATIPPFKTPRQLKMKQTGKSSVVQDVFNVKETEHTDSESEDETQFGVVWEKFVPEVVKGKPYPHDVFIPETEAQDDTQEAQPDSDDMLQSASKDMSESDDENIPFSRLQAKKTVRAKKKTTKTEVPKLQLGEACVGHLILKQFETGVFKGTVMTATKLRGRFLYHIVYKDGDSEDLNDKELTEGHE
jgi:hypothetical protein